MTFDHTALPETPILDNGMEPWTPDADDMANFAGEMQARGITIWQKENKGVSVAEFVESMGRTASRERLVTEGIDVTDLPGANEGT